MTPRVRGGHYDYGFRVYDPRLGRFFSEDPLTYEYPDQSGYSMALNRPTSLLDPDGREPIWGQLGAWWEIKTEIEKVDTEGHLSENFRQLARHFSYKLQYARDDGELVQLEPQRNVIRYVYTEDRGWLDLNHVMFAAAHYVATDEEGFFSATSWTTFVLGWGETIQDLLPGNHSGYSYEDLPSNLAGAEFAEKYGSAIRKGEITIADAMAEFLIGANAGDPIDAPNYEYIPHIATAEVPTVRRARLPLVGERLRESHRRVHESRSDEEQKNIEEAHRKFDD